jgi:hypothetical protein
MTFASKVIEYLDMPWYIRVVMFIVNIILIIFGILLLTDCASYQRMVGGTIIGLGSVFVLIVGAATFYAFKKNGALGMLNMGMQNMGMQNMGMQNNQNPALGMLNMGMQNMGMHNMAMQNNPQNMAMQNNPQNMAMQNNPQNFYNTYGNTMRSAMSN